MVVAVAAGEAEGAAGRVTSRRPTPRPTSRPTRAHLLRHFARNAGYGALVIVGSMVIGSAGFHLVARQSWIDAWLNAAMLLGGMGPVGDLSAGGDAGKFFASIFALYAGLVFLLTAGLLLTPVFHHVLHRFHWENDNRSD